MSIDWTHELTEQLDFHWRVQIRPRLDGLSDDEYRWEPVPGCWSVRRRGEAVSPMAAGGGDIVMDFAYPPPDPEPVTTIAWRLGHLIVGVFGVRADAHFGAAGATPVDYQSWEWSWDAAGALAQLDEQYGAWLVGVRGLDQGALERPCGPAEGPYAEYPFGALILHINREAIHHSAEIALLRDLYRATPR